MKYAVEMDLDALLYITKFRKDWFRHSKVDGGVGTQTYRQHGDYISLL
jgi:hypothetical protein